MTPTQLRSLRRRLLVWYDRNARQLPWRATRDPYAIWVSEIMLQQTQVATVVPYYARFMAEFPGIRELAEAEEQQVLRFWEGLGYYRRARHLHAAARLLAHKFEGSFPMSAEQARELPGLGRYTVNAILSQAFDQRLPIVEANSQRVICRLLALRGDPKSSEVRKVLWRTAEDLLPRQRVGDFNQAMMELGALVCTPVAPRCGECPLASCCRAKHAGLQEAIPTKSAKPSTVDVEEMAAVIQRGNNVLLAQRRADSRRWANLWEFPHLEVEPLESPIAAGNRLVDRLGLKIRWLGELAYIRHGITRYRIRMTCLLADYVAGDFHSEQHSQSVWIPPSQLSEFPVSSPQRVLAERVQEGARVKVRPRHGPKHR